MKGSYTATAGILISLGSVGASSAHGMDGLLFAQTQQGGPTNAPTITPVAPTFYMQGLVVAVLIAAAVGSVCWSSRR